MEPTKTQFMRIFKVHMNSVRIIIIIYLSPPETKLVLGYPVKDISLPLLIVVYILFGGTPNE